MANAAPAQGAPPAPNLVRNFSGATRQERQAAERLGAIYQELEGLNIHSLDKWAIPPPQVTPFVEYKREFELALIATYNFDLDRELRARGARRDTLTAGMVQTIELQKRYRADYYLLVPVLMQSAAVFAKKCLDTEAVALSQLLKDLSEQSSVAERLQVASRDILAAARNSLPRAMRKEEATREGRPEPAENVSEEPARGVSYLSPTEVREILRQLARRKARYAGDHLLEILLEHPEGVTILEEYAKSPAQGTVASTTRVLEALEALNKFSESTLQGGTFLRYPFFVLGGVVELNLHDIGGFKQYAVEIARILATDWRIEALSIGAIIIGCLSLALAGPAAPAIATVLLAGTDLALSGMLVFLEYMREREQDLGSRGSSYRREPIATPSLFISTGLAAASAMLSALSFFGAASQFRRVLRAPATPRAAAAPPKQLPDGRGLPPSRVGGTSLEEARATTPQQTGVPPPSSTASPQSIAPPPASGSRPPALASASSPGEFASGSTAATTDVKAPRAKLASAPESSPGPQSAGTAGADAKPADPRTLDRGFKPEETAAAEKRGVQSSVKVADDEQKAAQRGLKQGSTEGTGTKPGGKAPEPKPAADSPASKPHVEPEPQLAKFEGADIAKPTKEEVEATRNALKAQLSAMEKQGIIDAPKFTDLVMSVPQEETFARLNGVLLSGGKRGVPEGLSEARTTALQLAEQRAIDLRQRLAGHWDAALPGRGKNKLTAAEAADLLYKQLTKDPPVKGTLNAAVRDSLYDNWRGRFVDLVSQDKNLVRDLKEWAGVTFTPKGSKVTAFRVQAVDAAGNLSWVDLNWDHFFRHEDAVERAFRTGDSTLLIPTVDSANLAPNLARENQTFKEAIHKQNVGGWTVAPDPTPQAIQPLPH